MLDQRQFADIGTGEIGGKAAGLRAVAAKLSSAKETISRLVVPDFAVVRTDVFDSFMALNGLWEAERLHQEDGALAREFVQAAFPATYVGALWQLAQDTEVPLAVRSSSLLEDALSHPFAGIYLTKMVAFYEPDPAARFRALTEAIKLVYASVFFARAVAYQKTVGARFGQEKMAVVLQPVVGSRLGRRFYPTISGVLRSVSYYPFGHATPEDGVAHLALGLGKAIVDGETTWQYCPRFPASPPPLAGPRDILSSSQRSFWAVRMSSPGSPAPLAEDEHLVQLSLDEALYDGQLSQLVSHYDHLSDRIRPGLGEPEQPVALTFAPLLHDRSHPFNADLLQALTLCEEALNSPVEIEFAATRQSDSHGLLVSLLQARPVHALAGDTALSDALFHRDSNVVVSMAATGNGTWPGIARVVYVKPEGFTPASTREAALELADVNRLMREAGHHYLLIGFGRWGSHDPWLGIPVTWGDIGHARGIVEVMLTDWRVDFSQGSHFFHNLTSFDVPYLSIGPERGRVDFEWLLAQPSEFEGRIVRAVSVTQPLTLVVDGRQGRGVVTR